MGSDAIELRGRLCKICSLPPELVVQVDGFLKEGTPLREIAHILTLTGRSVSFMAVARHKKHFRPNITPEQAVRIRELESLERKFLVEFAKFKRERRRFFWRH